MTTVSPVWLADVRDLARVHSAISPFMIHRRLRIGRRAAESLLRELEREGMVGPRSPGGSREVVNRG